MTLIICTKYSSVLVYVKVMILTFQLKIISAAGVAAEDYEEDISLYDAIILEGLYDIYM